MLSNIEIINVQTQIKKIGKTQSIEKNQMYMQLDAR